jgi:hypothetical protein
MGETVLYAVIVGVLTSIPAWLALIQSWLNGRAVQRVMVELNGPVGDLLKAARQAAFSAGFAAAVLEAKALELARIAPTATPQPGARSSNGGEKT